MTDWTPLRDFLRQGFEAWINDLILHDPDREARALLAGNRGRVLTMLVDQAELVVLRRIVASGSTPTGCSLRPSRCGSCCPR
jgi:hypothetical protein